MKSLKQEKAKRLFCAIGEVDDSLLQEALLYAPPRRNRLSRVLLLAATLSLVSVLLVAALAISMRSKQDQSPTFNDDYEHSLGKDPQSLDQILLTERDSDSHTTLASPEEIPFFDGKSYLVWQYADSDELCISRALTDRELATLGASLGDGKAVGDQSPALSCRVWVVYGNGSVISPYLLPSSGNTASATLFDYEAELVPSDAFSSCISDILD